MKISNELAEAVKPIVMVVVVLVIIGGMYLIFSIVGLPFPIV